MVLKNKMLLPSQLYQQKITNEELKHDTAQENILPILDELTKKLNKPAYKKIVNNITAWHYENDENPQGVFMCGDVGRGKSMLMQLFFDCVCVSEKRRVHFHPFMEEMHERMHEPHKKNDTDIILQIASDIAKSARLLCFDEFYVTNIGDAVLLGRLLEALFKCGVTLCATSNWQIDSLYQDGYNRSLFQPFIKIIEQNMLEVNLNSPNDWRRKNIICNNKDNSKKQSFLTSLLENKATWQAGEIDLLGTIIPLSHYKDEVLIVDFKNICDIYIGRQRYLILSKQIKGIIIKNIPYLDKEKSGAAMRFVILVDLLYEHGVPLIATTLNKQDNIEELCEEGPVKFAFARTLSRLAELGQL